MEVAPSLGEYCHLVDGFHPKTDRPVSSRALSAQIVARNELEAQQQSVEHHVRIVPAADIEHDLEAETRTRRYSLEVPRVCLRREPINRDLGLHLDIGCGEVAPVPHIPGAVIVEVRITYDQPSDATDRHTVRNRWLAWRLVRLRCPSLSLLCGYAEHLAHEASSAVARADSGALAPLPVIVRVETVHCAAAARLLKQATHLSLEGASWNIGSSGSRVLDDYLICAADLEPHIGAPHMQTSQCLDRADDADFRHKVGKRILGHGHDLLCSR